MRVFARCSLTTVASFLWCFSLSSHPHLASALSPLFQASSRNSRKQRSVLPSTIRSNLFGKKRDWSFQRKPRTIGYGEESRKYRRTVFDHSDWRKHRAQDRFIHNIGTALSSGIYKNIRGYVLTVSIMATLVCAWNTVAATTRGWAFLPTLLRHLKIALPMAPFSLAMPSLGLLLVFRTNTAYARWDEARKNWGLNINHTRDLTRKATAYYDAAATSVDANRRQADLQQVALGVWAFARAMKRHLSPPEDDETAFCQDVQQRLPSRQAQALIAAQHRPNRALQDLSTVIESLPLHFLRKDKLHASLTRFEDNLGSSERLLSSPVPLFYTRHTTRFLATWISLLPLALYEAFQGHIAMIPATMVLSTCLFGIDELATQLEEPFTILPMDTFCDKIYESCTEIVSFQPSVETATTPNAREPSPRDSEFDVEDPQQAHHQPRQLPKDGLSMAP